VTIFERRYNMFRVFGEERLITAGMFLCLGLSIILRVFLGLLYRNMIKEADNMASTENRLLKQCKTKFASCYQMSNGVANIPIFVDKFLNRMALGHLSFETLYHLSGQLMLLAVVFSGVGVCKSIMGGRTLGDVLPFYIVSFFGLYIFFSVSTVVDIRGKKRVLKVNLVDYLENHLSPRIEVTRQDMEMLYGESTFTERKRNTGRVSRSRSGRNSRRNGKGVQSKPVRRTLELMPIGNRMAVGGEELADETLVNETLMDDTLVNETLMNEELVDETLANETLVNETPTDEILMNEEPTVPIFTDPPKETTVAPEDTAEVTEEELEALLKEFLTF